MTRVWVWVLMAGALCGACAAADATQLAAEFENEIRPAIVKLCGDCHKKDKDVPLMKAVKFSEFSATRPVWRSAAGQLRNRTMPPADETSQPTEDERNRLAGWIEAALRQTAVTMDDYAGAPIARRLNRVEYDNTIRDLTGLAFNYSETFPTEGAGGEGFNNNGETLFLPAILMERYMESAQQILSGAIISPPLQKSFPAAEFFAIVRSAKGQEKPDAAEVARLQSGLKAERLVNNSESAVSIAVFETGDYEVGITARADAKTEALVELKIDDIVAHKFTIGDTEKPNVAVLRLQRGVHTISLSAAAVPTAFSKMAILEKQPLIKDAKRAAHQRIFGALDSTKINAQPAEARRAEAQRVIDGFAARAYRRPLKPGEIERLMGLYERSASRGDPFEESIKLALKAVLVSSHFLFRVETDHETSGVYPLDDFELASRLSYFLWASMPDDELLRLAGEKKLHEKDVLLAQIQRMLTVEGAGGKPKAYAFMEDFVGQWLGTKEVGASVAFATEKLKTIYSSDLADELRTEPVLIFRHLIEENRSLLEFIDADYIFATERTAKHYGVENVKGTAFQRVAVSDGRRGGLLGLGAVHMITSYPDRTSAVLRGAWVLESMLGVRVPNPPPDVPPIAAARKKQKEGSMRAVLELHRANPTCATCHNVIDPIGFGLENYDMIGRWRDVDGKLKVDAAATMPSGEKFNGPGELKKILLGRKGDFARLISSKMLGYALGRSLEGNDDVTLEKLVSALERDGFKTRTLIQEIVLSTPFRNRQGGEAARKNAAPKKKKELPASKN